MNDTRDFVSRLRDGDNIRVMCQTDDEGNWSVIEGIVDIDLYRNVTVDGFPIRDSRGINKNIMSVRYVKEGA